MKNCSATKEILICDVYSIKKTTNTLVIPIPNVKIVWKENYLMLQDELNQYFRTRSIHCQNCNADTARLTYELGSYLYIDVEDSYKESTYAQKHEIDAENFTTGLDSIPTQLKMQNFTYVLGGVIEYISGEIGHYIAHCRSLTGFWIKRNDLLKKKRI